MKQDVKKDFSPAFREDAGPEGIGDDLGNGPMKVLRPIRAFRAPAVLQSGGA